jgi:hypothetical protein
MSSFRISVYVQHFKNAIPNTSQFRSVQRKVRGQRELIVSRDDE